MNEKKVYATIDQAESNMFYYLKYCQSFKGEFFRKEFTVQNKEDMDQCFK